MRVPIIFAALLALTGCATDAVGPHADNNRAPHEWRVVSVTPVPAGTAARVASTSADGKAVEFSSRPVDPAPVYRSQPSYHPQYQSGYRPQHQPHYQPYYQSGYQPYHHQPLLDFYALPITIGLGFSFGRHWFGGSRHHFGHRRHRHR